MDKHEIVLSNRQRKLPVTDELKAMVCACARAVLEEEDFPREAEVSVTFVSNEKIRAYNREFRDKDAVTDVLSFPLLEFDEDKHMRAEDEFEPEGEKLLLGDVIISLERAAEQAREYGHSFEREVGFLTVHSMYHLLGYDHMQEQEQKQMRGKEEGVLTRLGLLREPV